MAAHYSDGPLRAAHYSSFHWRSCTLSGLRNIRGRGTAIQRLSLLRTLGAVLRTGLLTVLDALQVEGTAHDVITHTGQVLHTTATHQNDRVLLQVVAFTADVRNDFVTVGQTHLGDLTQSGVRLLGVVVYTRVHTPRRCGQFSSAGLLLLMMLTSRGLRTSWLMVGMTFEIPLRTTGKYYVLVSSSDMLGEGGSRKTASNVRYVKERACQQTMERAVPETAESEAATACIT